MALVIDRWRNSVSADAIRQQRGYVYDAVAFRSIARGTFNSGTGGTKQRSVERLFVDGRNANTSRLCNAHRNGSVVVASYSPYFGADGVAPNTAAPSVASPAVPTCPTCPTSCPTEDAPFFSQKFAKELLVATVQGVITAVAIYYVMKWVK